MFWSLCFGCKATTYQQIGGFDPGYGGYGGEDTDFAFAARRAGGFLFTYWERGCTISTIPYRTHRCSTWRTSFQCPLFPQKWGCWPMEGWLRAFRRAGVIRWEGDEVEVV